MPTTAQAVLMSWSIPPAATFALLVTAAIYLRGWLLLRHARVPFVPTWRAVSFLLGLVSLWVALASPLDTFSGLLLTAHMTQHMLLMMVAPPLILMGAPLIPLVRGVPVFAAREFAGPFLNWRVATRAGNALIHPAVALSIMGVTMFAWHTPRLYELALRSGAWHEVEHACFFFASLIFWWPVIQPWPSRSQRARWIAVPYLLIGDLQNTILSAILVFSDRVLYPSYTSVPRLFGFRALADQAASGAIMWVLGSVIFLIPASVIAVQCLSSRRAAAQIIPAAKSPSVDRLFTVAQRMSIARGWWQRRTSSARSEAITFVALFVIVGLVVAALASRPSDDDDQALRLSQTSGAFVISVFGAPGDVEVGESEFSVLVQDRDSLQALTDAGVEMQAVDGARTSGPVRASAGDSENKLLQAAEIELPDEGEWKLSVKVGHDGQGGEVTLPVRVVKAEGGVAIPWAYLVFVLFAAVLGFAYWRRHRRDGAVAAGLRDGVAGGIG